MSAFTPCGLLAFSGAPSQAETIYRSIVSAQGGDEVNYSFAKGSRQDAWTYATAMCLARAQVAIDGAAHQSDSRRVTWFLSQREEEYGLSPAPTDDIPTRQKALTAARQIVKGSNPGSLVTGLQAVLGSVFLGVRITKPSERVTFPASIGDQPQSFQLPSTSVMLFQTTAAISSLGSVEVRYRYFSNGRIVVKQGPPQLLVGQTVVVGSEHPSHAERVVITARGNIGETQTFTATFTKAHESGALVSTANYPLWVTNQRTILVVVTPSAALDLEVRRKVNQYMRRVVRGTTTWAIVGGVAGTIGPFILDQSHLDATPFVATTY